MRKLSYLKMFKAIIFSLAPTTLVHVSVTEIFEFSTRTTNQKYQKKGNHAKMQKKTSLIFFFVVNISMPKIMLEVKYSRTSRKLATIQNAKT